MESAVEIEIQRRLDGVDVWKMLEAIKNGSECARGAQKCSAPLCPLCLAFDKLIRKHSCFSASGSHAVIDYLANNLAAPLIGLFMQSTEWLEPCNSIQPGDYLISFPITFSTNEANSLVPTRSCSVYRNPFRVVRADSIVERVGLPSDFVRGLKPFYETKSHARLFLQDELLDKIKPLFAALRGIADLYGDAGMGNITLRDMAALGKHIMRASP